jgi:iron(III) transport system permease protein
MDYSVPSLFQVNVYSLELFAEYGASNEPARVILLALPLLIIALGVVLASQSALRSVVQSSGWNIPTWNVLPRWPKWFICLQVVAAALLVFQIIVPLISLIAEVGTWNNLASTTATAGKEIAFTFWIAVLSAVICLPLAFAPARELLKQEGWKWLWWVLVLAPLAIPPPLTGVGLIYIWNRPIFPGVYGSSLMPVLAALARFTPFAAIVLAVQLRRIDPLLIEAARIIQSNRYQTWFRIWVPMLVPGLVAACGVVFALTAGELGATLIVAPPGRATLTMMIYNLLHYGATSAVAGLCLMMAVFSVIAGTLAVLALTGWSRLFPGKA